MLLKVWELFASLSPVIWQNYVCQCSFASSLSHRHRHTFEHKISAQQCRTQLSTTSLLNLRSCFTFTINQTHLSERCINVHAYIPNKIQRKCILYWTKSFLDHILLQWSAVHYEKDITWCNVSPNELWQCLDTRCPETRNAYMSLKYLSVIQKLWRLRFHCMPGFHRHHAQSDLAQELWPCRNTWSEKIHLLKN